MQSTDPITLLTPCSPVTHWLAAVRAGTLGLAVVITGCSSPSATSMSIEASPSPSVTPTPTASPSEPASPRPSATPEPTPVAIGDWRKLEGEPTPYLHDLVVGPASFVGVGFSSDLRTPAIWRSADGRNWSEEAYELEAEFASDGTEILYLLTATDDGLVAIGSPIFGIAESDDGLIWTHASLEEGACPSALAARGDTIAAVGGIGPCQMGGFGNPRAWSSADGGDWISAPFETGLGFLHGVTATAAGFVAWGQMADDEPFGGAPWFSSDGLSWQRVDDPGPFAGASIEGMATIGQATVAIGWVVPTGDPQAAALAAWISDDGTSWALLDAEVPFADVEQGMGIGIGGGAPGVAVWTQGVPGVTTMIWTSADGRSWDTGTELPVGMLRVAAMGDGLIAYGTLEEANPGIAVPCDKDDVVEGRCRTVPAVWILERVP